MNAWVLCFKVIVSLNLQFSNGYKGLKLSTSLLSNQTEVNYKNDADMSEFLMGGKLAKKGQFPGAVVVRWPSGVFHTCGIILHKSWVLTIAHQFPNIPRLDSWFVTAGDLVWTPLDKSKSLTKVIEVHINPNYITRGRRWNLCILKVTPDILVGGFWFKILPLPYRPLRLGEKCQIATWGKRSNTPGEIGKLHWANVELVSRTEDGLAILGDPTGKASMCYDVTGASYICDDYISALYIAHIDRSCVNGSPGIAVELYHVKPWIKHVLGDPDEPKAKKYRGWLLRLLIFFLIITIIFRHYVWNDVFPRFSRVFLHIRK